MHLTDQDERGGKGRCMKRRIAALMLLAGAPLLTGCEADSFIDPSVLGRWEHTPTVVPVLDRIAAIERDDAEFVETSDVTPEDLIPVAAEYRITTGDALTVKIRDFLRLGEEAEFQRAVDKRGYIEIPRLAPVRVVGLTPLEARDAVAVAIRDAQLLNDPTVSVVPVQQRQQTFSVFGAVQTAGTYFVPSPDYRLLQALTAAGGFQETATSIYVIRQVPLDLGLGETPGGAGTPQTKPPTEPGKLIDLIEELSKPKEQPPPSGSPPPSPGRMGGEKPAMVMARVQPPEGKKAEPPPIDLPDTPAPAQPAPTAQAPAGGEAGRTEFQWVFLNGQWVKTGVQTAAPSAGGAKAAPATTDMLVTQRVIRIPTAALVAGASRYNIVIRPGDIIRVPGNAEQLFYVGGQVARPGVYVIPKTGRITITNAITSAGGLSPIAIPERTDLTRMIGTNHQATIRLDLRAIAEGTQPNIYLKNDDAINIGTNFWAFPLAVLRNGLRTSYGFGLVVDRNFGSDIFGVPPEAKAQGGGF